MAFFKLSFFTLTISILSLESVPIQQETTKNPLTYYKGTFIDLSTPWISDYANPKSEAWTKAASKYHQQILSTVSIYSGLGVTVVQFEPAKIQTEEGVKNFVKVEFLFTLHGSNVPVASSVQAQMVSGAKSQKFRWQDIEIVDPFNPTPTPTASIGTSPGWKRASDMLYSAMNESVDPCDNFYQFSCGKWIASHSIPGYLKEIDVITELVLNIMTDVGNLFTNLKPNSIYALQQGKIYYDACTKGVTTGNDTAKIYRMLVGYGNWPILSQNWKGPIGGEQLGSASALIGRLMGTIGTTTFFDGQPSVDWKTPKRNVFLFYPPEPLVPVDTPLQKLVDEIIAIAKMIAKGAGVEIDDNQIKADAMELASLEVKLSKIIGNPQLNFPFPYNVYNASTAQKRWVYWDWNTLLSKFAQDNIDPKTMVSAPLIIPVLDYFDKLGAFFNGIPDRTLQNFLLWRLVYKEVQNVPSFGEHRDQLYKLRTGTQEAAPIWLHCSGQAINNLPWATGRLYVEDWLNRTPSSTASQLHQMVGDVLTSFHGMLSNLEWVDAKTRSAADSKVKNLVKNVAYPPFLMNDAFMNAMYKNLALKTTDDTFDIVNKVLHYSMWSTLQQIGEFVDRTNMQGSPAVVNAWYSPQYNNINFPAAILNEPFFHVDRPMAVNFGMIGAIMGHELTHGFDNNGVHWDGFGVYDPQSWMTNQSRAGFRKMADCVVDEYKDFCFPEVHMCMNGKQTEGENIADNGGVMASIRAYESFVGLSGPEPRLPGPMSKYSMEQIFFIAYGHNWCSNVTDDALIQEIQFGSHSPDKVRILEVVKNIPQFAKAFNCPIGSSMAPFKHCHVWVN